MTIEASPPAGETVAAARKIRVIFVCTGNSARSQMAEAILRNEAGDVFEVMSAGVTPRPVNPLTIALARAGRDRHQRCAVEAGRDVPRAGDSTTSITLCDRARLVCPVFPGGGETLHWGLDDPTEVEGTEAERAAAFDRVLTGGVRPDPAVHAPGDRGGGSMTGEKPVAKRSTSSTRTTRLQSPAGAATVRKPAASKPGLQAAGRQTGGTKKPAEEGGCEGPPRRETGLEGNGSTSAAKSTAVTRAGADAPSPAHFDGAAASRGSCSTSSATRMPASHHLDRRRCGTAALQEGPQAGPPALAGISTDLGLEVDPVIDVASSRAADTAKLVGKAIGVRPSDARRLGGGFDFDDLRGLVGGLTGDVGA